MIEHIRAYVKQIDQRYQTGQTTEHSFRGDLQQLLQACTGFIVINEQKHIDCGAPDLTLLSKQLPIAYIEAKDLEDGDLDGRKKNKEQFDRYKASLDTLIFTDYLDFHLYEHGEWQLSVRLAEIQGKRIRLSDADRFIALMEHLKTAAPQRITSAGKLAQLMAGKARMLRDIIEQALIQDGDNPTELRSYMEDFRKVLIHDITPKQFADIYAQTIAYGMFAARLHDTTPDDFTRSEAANLIPKSNPFLRKVFQQIAGYDLDERIAWIVDDLVCAFAATDMDKIMQGFGKSTGQTDPILHFYEDFLFQYDPAAKKQCGVYYTPQPVVNFIVRAVDELLKQEFNLPMGLADTSKVDVEREIEQDLKHRKEKVQMHRVQVLDPATGTGTFLAEAVRQIKRDLSGQMGAWQQYVPEHLLPRLYGFELMMAPYTIAHLKLDMEIGVSSQDRINVYLTNSLEESNPDTGTLFGGYLAREANAASRIKRDTPVMIVMGNPPYSISSNNKGEWINHLIDDYKKNLNERNIQPLSDDYIKFIRLAQHYVERNGEGIVAYISNNSFIDGLIHRQMRSELMRVFDAIYILDLHGNTRKKETAPDGSKDENVFDIMQGVSINIFVKKSAKNKKPADVYHYDLFGTREYKYVYLQKNNLYSVEWRKLEPQKENYYFAPKDNEPEKEYNKGFELIKIMPYYSSGITTSNDSKLSAINEPELIELLEKNAIPFKGSSYLYKVCYKPFDDRVYYLNPEYALRPRPSLIRNYKNQPNLSFSLRRTAENTIGWQHIFASDKPCDGNLMSARSYSIPLYLYPEEGSIDMTRRPNLDETIWSQINSAIGHEASPEDIFDYIYGVLHSPAYRAKYKEFLKVDFPRIPYPKNADEFEHFRYYGNQLRELHLMHNVPQSPVLFNQPGDLMVEQVTYDGDNVHINATQYFEHVPETAWNMYIGGYQPAQKWLKDRRGRTLRWEDVDHYRNIIAVLSETARLMEQVPL